RPLRTQGAGTPHDKAEQRDQHRKRGEPQTGAAGAARTARARARIEEIRGARQGERRGRRLIARVPPPARWHRPGGWGVPVPGGLWPPRSRLTGRGRRCRADSDLVEHGVGRRADRRGLPPNCPRSLAGGFTGPLEQAAYIARKLLWAAAAAMRE